MFNIKFKYRIIKNVSIVIATVSWLLLLFSGILEQAPSINVPAFIKGNLNFFKSFLLNTFFLGGFIYAELRNREIIADFNRLIGRVFFTGLVCTLISGLLTLSLLLLDDYSANTSPLLFTVFFHIEFGLLILFLLAAFTTWKQMILYEKGSFTAKSWQIFEYILAGLLIYNFFHLGRVDTYYFNVPFAILLVWIIILSTNVKWVPLLNFNQKLLAIVQLLIILFCLAYFFTSITSYFYHEPLVADDLSKSVVSSTVFAFVCIYAFGTLLVALFNLPTTSVFEKKFKELMLFQQLSEDIIEGENEAQVFKSLLESAVSSVKADAAWIESSSASLLITESLHEKYVTIIRNFVENLGFEYSKTQRFHRKFLSSSWPFPFDSVLAVPLLSSNKEQLGSLFLLKKVTNGFDSVTVSMINSFVLQAGIAIQNFRLLSALVENQRFQNELQIAHEIQQKLFPVIPNSQHYQDFEIFAHSESATEVGGDYYDVYNISEKKYALIIADVSGKGVSAAFYMAQMKGIFQCLVPLNLNPDKFMIYANAALSNCLEKSSFITATYYYIDTEFKHIYLSRAGHCPTLYYDHQKNDVSFLENSGLGLGIIRSEKFKDYVGIDMIKYKEGDLIALYTDGIIEVKNEILGEQFGYERLKDFLKKKVSLPLDIMYQELLKTIAEFVGEETKIDDDFTVIFIRF